MQHWLHHIGRAYYTRASFVREAKKYGVTRRVAVNTLKKMKFGDRVILAIAEGKHPAVFGYFVIEKVSGLSLEVVEKIKKEHDCLLAGLGGETIERGCGEYTSGPTFSTSATIEEIAEVIEKTEDKGRPMVGGTFYELELVKLKDIPFRQGFRLFDYEKFLKAPKLYSKNGKIPYVKGQFYVDKADDDAECEGFIQSVEDYRRKEGA
jgi:hypothetical protein